MTCSTILALVVCSRVLWLFASLACRWFSHFALVWLTGLVIGQEVARVAVFAAIRVTGLALRTISRSTIKGLALQTFRQLVSEIALLALIVGCSIAGSLAFSAGTFGANSTIIRLATQLLSQEEARIASRTVVVLGLIFLSLAFSTA